MVVFMAMHPMPHSHELGNVVKSLAEGGTYNTAIHGVLIGLIVLVLIGTCGLAAKLGLGALEVRGGLVAQALATVILIGAATVNGVILPRLCEKYSAASGDRLEPARALLILCAEANHACDHIGIWLQSAAIVLWSLALVRRKGSGALGAFGFLLGLAAPTALVAGKLPMTVHGFGAFVLATAVWYVWSGSWLIREHR